MAKGIAGCFGNSGQSCNTPTRMFVPLDRESEVKAIARRTAERFRVGDPRSTDTQLGPVVSEVQFEWIQGLIQSGIDGGAELLIGGVGRPEGLNRGHYVRPAIFAGARPEMRISREIFGPVLSILTYRNLDEAVELANDTPYGLQAYVQSADLTQARRVAARLCAGRISIN
ncbi:aldehyde dehydrogenase family protein [Roseomonas gilardii]|uniref:aldehyde dehydrogenase family protein n=1 Tax=Roseomonas gilardii TaxID=257708 RepID=UPI0004B75FEA